MLCSSFSPFVFFILKFFDEVEKPGLATIIDVSGQAVADNNNTLALAASSLLHSAAAASAVSAAAGASGGPGANDSSAAVQQHLMTANFSSLAQACQAASSSSATSNGRLCVSWKFDGHPEYQNNDNQIVGDSSIYDDAKPN